MCLGTFRLGPSHCSPFVLHRTVIGFWDCLFPLLQFRCRKTFHKLLSTTNCSSCNRSNHCRDGDLPVAPTCGSVGTQTHIVHTGTTNPMEGSTDCAQTQAQSLDTPCFPLWEQDGRWGVRHHLLPSMAWWWRNYNSQSALRGPGSCHGNRGGGHTPNCAGRICDFILFSTIVLNRILFSPAI